MLDDLTAEELVAIAHLVHVPRDGTMVFVGDVLHTIDSVPGIKTLLTKVNEAGKRDDVRRYVALVYGEVYG